MIPRAIFAATFLFLSTVSCDVRSQSNNSANAFKVENPRSTRDLMNLIADKFIKENSLKKGQYNRGDWNVVSRSENPKMMSWSYPTGVTLLAMQQMYQITKNKKLLDFVNTYVNISADQYDYLRWQVYKFGKTKNNGSMGKLMRLDMLDDYGAIGAAILESKLRHGATFSKNVDDLIGILSNQIENVQYRLENGTLWRPNSPDGPTIWADDLFMSLPFIIRLAEYKKDRSLLDFAVLQVINYASYLQDADGVWYHAYFVDSQSRSCCKWGRGNGWVAVAVAQVLTAMPTNHAKYQEVLAIYKKQIDGIIKLQDKDGLWNQVLDHPELSWGTETTCSAQFMYAIARGINKGWLDASYVPVATKALAGISDYSRIEEDGDLLKVCASTSIGKDLEYYNTRAAESIGNTARHGDGLILLALAEMSLLLER